MIEDSIARTFSGSAVSVAGVGLWEANDSLVKKYVADRFSITFSMAENGATVGSSYTLSSNGYTVAIVIVDKDGVVQFVHQEILHSIDSVLYKKMAGDAASKIRSMLSTGIDISKTATAFAVRHSTGLPRYFTLSGQIIGYQVTLTTRSVLVRSLDGRATTTRNSFKHNRK